MTRTATALENVLTRDRMLLFAGLAVVVVLSGIYTILGAGMPMSALDMTRMAVEMPGMMMQPAVWSPAYALLVFLMWWVMMIAMMVPSAAPAVLVYAGIVRKRKSAGQPYASASFFLSGYLIAWAAFSFAATLLQRGLEFIGVMTGMMEIASPLIAGAVLVTAGLYQLTPLKNACLRHCQHPVLFLLHHWKPKAIGAFRMGLEHGGYCVGCCWFLMALLFVGGIMNLYWIAGIAIYVGVEKLAAGHRWVTKAAAAVMTIAGILVAAKPYLAV